MFEKHSFADLNRQALADRDARLVARVNAVNNANAYIIKIGPALIEAFKPWVGQQIIKATCNEFLAKVEKSLPVFPHSQARHVYKTISNYSLSYTVKTCEPLPQSCVYHEQTIYIADLNKGILLELLDISRNTWKTDYTVEGVLAAREAYKQAKKLADEAQSALHPFGEYDR